MWLMYGHSATEVVVSCSSLLIYCISKAFSLISLIHCTKLLKLSIKDY